jgi:hypothetical protein
MQNCDGVICPIIPNRQICSFLVETFGKKRVVSAAKFLGCESGMKIQTLLQEEDRMAALVAEFGLDMFRVVFITAGPGASEDDMRLQLKQLSPENS